MTSANNKISNHISSQVPFFVRNDHPQFVAFLEAYFKYLEQENKAVETAASLRDQIDIDQTKSLYEEQFYNTFLKLIPKDSIVDKKLLLKNVKDFYRSRGTEKSVCFLMRVLFDEEVTDFYYPKKDILKVSDGKWFVERSLKIASVNINGVVTTDQSVLQNFIGKQIKGSTSSATAIVEGINTYYDAGILVNELKISNEYKSFVSAETVSTLFTDTDGVQKTLTAQLFQSGIEAVTLTSAGTGYKIGDTINVESNTGTGGVIIVSSVSTGSLNFLSTINGGAGFQTNTQTLISGGGGTGANARISSVNTNEQYHPNSYNIVSSTISLEANTQIGNAVYSNLNSSNASSNIGNAMSYFTYANVGPIQTVLVISSGNNYTSIPTVSAQANTIVRSLGILGRMEIVNSGLGYAIGNIIEFINVPGGYGTGALANVTNVNANGSITKVNFIQMPGHIIGGTGYDQFYLPKANVVSGTGNGANIVVTAVLGRGETLKPSMTAAGSILSLSTISRGSGYQTTPTLNLKSIGDGTATAYATVISGAFSYPGRYLNDDGHVSGYNFIEDRDYYQTYSYVIKIKRSINDYRKAVNDLIHPAGMKLFGEYMTEDNGSDISVLQNVEQAAARGLPNPVLDIYFNSANIDANITYSRTSTASLVDANGNIQYYSANTPRIGYKSNRESKGIYIEEQSTNLFIRSQDFANTSWTKRANSAVTANAVMAPDNTMTGTLYYDTGTSSGTYVSASPAPTTVNNTVYTASAFVKRADMPMVRLTVYARSSVSNVAYTDFNFDTNTVSTITVGTVSQVSGGATPVANGWWRIWVTSNTGSGTNLIPFRLGSSATYGLPSGNGKSSVYIWGAQLETGGAPTTYIPTTNTSLTRAADIMTVQDSAFSNVYSATAGALYVEGTPSANVSNLIRPPLATLSDNSGNYRVSMSISPLSYPYSIYSFFRTPTQYTTAVSIQTLANAPIRSIITYSSSGPVMFSANGNLLGFGTSNTINTSVTRITIGAGDSYFNGFIKNVRYYNRYVSNSTLQLLTARP